jgi:hypothetical protein
VVENGGKPPALGYVTENPRVGGSIPPPGTFKKKGLTNFG